jgi:cytochrome c oxidase subunit 3
MSTAESHVATEDGHGENGQHAHHHDPHLAHHFETPDQQYTSGKLGMWMFLGTEVLMFGGLFCAYAVYRHNHPEVFEYAHQYLDKNLGALNTIILITSSLTMAWGVRAAQMGKKGLLVALLALTILGGAGFMVVKTIEYSTKWKHHLFIGSGNDFYGDAADTTKKDAVNKLEEEELHANEGAAAPGPVTKVEPDPVDPNAGTPDAATIKAPNITPAGLSVKEAGAEKLVYADLNKHDRHRVYTFFAIYFMMTGLHGVHVLVGMALIAWILYRAAKGEFGPSYFTPVDLVGLYWHLVDLIWIFLFPLLYLIH